MLFHALYSLVLLLIFPAANSTTAAAPPPYSATDFILLNCGESSTLNDTRRRTWNGDEHSRYAPPNASAISSASTASSMDPSVFQVPYQTARVFRSPFRYAFPVSAGQKFLRLYFYPNVYSDFNASQSLFSVTANAFTLLNNFSAFLYSKNPSQPSFMKEFVINVGEDQKLDLTFHPNSNSFAFVNGIEIVSIPDKLYFKGNDVAIKFVDQLFYLNSSTALENLYRLNVGGNRIEIQDDSGPTRGMFRAWTQDDPYILGTNFGYTPHREGLPIKYTADTPPYSAPEAVYTTSRVMANYSSSLDWLFPVDSGFYYLLRLHFCEIQLEVTKQNQRLFTISINNQTAEIAADVIFWTGGTQIPIFKDYVTWVPDNGRRGKQVLWLSLFPNTEASSKYSNVLLNGLEILKLSDKESLAAGNPELATDSSSAVFPETPWERKKRGGSSIIYVVVGGVIGFLTVVSAVAFLIRRCRPRVKYSASATKTSDVELPSNLCRYFSLDEIKTATRNFDDDYIIGGGGFGNVYKGLIDGTTVAIKRQNASSNQGAREFRTEIEMLSKLRHVHLASLIGYCEERGEMILVYDYMAHGTLRSHLYKSDNPPLTWKQRLRICLGAARGLHYLHTGTKSTIIHRDVKSTNILLDEKWVAKVSDFGLSKVGSTGGEKSHVSTAVKGSFGYVDPEYYRRQQLTDKSDVYSFGVVLFEVLCARQPIILSLPREQVNLAEWAKFSFRKGTVEQITDSNLDGQIAPESLSKFVETAVACLREKGIDRPAMGDVIWSLEFAMQLQEAAEAGHGDCFVALSPSPQSLGIVKPSSMDDETFFGSSVASGSKTSVLSTTSSGERLKPGEIFSEIMDPLGR